MPLSFSTVPGHSGLIMNKGKAPPDQPIKQSRFSNIGSPNDGNGIGRELLHILNYDFFVSPEYLMTVALSVITYKAPSAIIGDWLTPTPTSMVFCFAPFFGEANII